MRSSTLRAALLGSLTLAWAGMAPSPAASEPPAGLSTREAHAPQAWAEVVPFAPRVEASLVRFSPASERLVLPAVEGGAALVCLGGDELAVDCRELDLSSPTEIDPWLAPGVAVEGRIRLGREPLAGAAVAVAGSGYRLRRSHVLPLAVERDAPTRWVETAEDGRFVLPQLAAGGYRLEIERPGGKGELSAPFTVPPAEALLARAGGDVPERNGGRAVLELGPVVLEPGLEVEVSVLTVAGEPLEGATVDGIQTDGPQGAPARYSVSTGAEGRGVISGAEPGVALELSCRAPGYLTHEERFPSPPTDVVCLLEPSSSVTGRVLADGAPVSEATATLDPGAGVGRTAPRQRRIRSGVHGRFSIADLAPGAHRLVVAAPGFEAAEQRFTLAPGERLELTPIRLAPAPELHAIVVDAVSGEPVAGTSVTSLEPAGAVETVSDATGRFRFAAGAPGGLRLRLDATGYPAKVVEVAPGAFDDEAVRLELARGGRIEAVVYDEQSGEPCLGCDLAYYRLDTPSQASSGALRTDAGGRAHSEPLAPGPYRVVLERVSTHGTTVSVRSGDDARRIEVEPGQSSRVVFGAPHETLRVRLWPPPPPGWRVAAGDARGWRTYRPDTAGWFTLKRLSSSDVRLRLQGGRGEPVTVSLPSVPADHDGPRLEVELPRSLVRGRLLGLPGGGSRSLRALPLTGTGARAWTLAGEDGSFTLPFLPAGSYALHLGDRRVTTFTLAPAQHLELETEVATAP